MRGLFGPLDSVAWRGGRKKRPDEEEQKILREKGVLDFLSFFTFAISWWVALAEMEACAFVGF